MVSASALTMFSNGGIRMRKFTPAIPKQEEPLFPFRFYEINERVTVFDDELHTRLRKCCNHIVKDNIDGQLSLDGGVWNG